jgi:hypothetical protein
VAVKNDPQIQAALSAAKAREAIADRIAKLAPVVEDDPQALLILHLAEAYASLAAEPPRVRAS